MKLKAVGAFLTRRKNLVILDDGGQQWIGDGSNFYLLPENLGEIDEKIACAIFDIEKEKAANWKILRMDFPKGYDTSDTTYGAPYLVAKDGMFTEAIIMPVVTKPEMTGWLTGLCNGIASAHLYGKVDEIGTEE